MDGEGAAWRYATQVSLCKRKNRAVQRYAMGRGAEIPNVQRYIISGRSQKERVFFFPDVPHFLLSFSVFPRRNMDFRTLLDRPAHATADPKGIAQKFHNGNSWMEQLSGVTRPTFPFGNAKIVLFSVTQ